MAAITLYSIVRMLMLPLVIFVTFYGYRFIHAAAERLRKRDAHRPALLGGAILSLAIVSALKLGLAPPSVVDGPAIVLVILLAASILLLVESAVFGAIRIVRYRQHWADALGWGAWEGVGTLLGSVVALVIFQALLFAVLRLFIGLPRG